VIDLIYIAHKRPEYTEASLAALLVNTNWDLVNRVWFYTDGDMAPSVGWLANGCSPDTRYTCDFRELGGPVPIMLDYLSHAPADLWAKIDNDVIVPRGWLDACVRTMDDCPELDLLGIEPPLSRTPAPWAPAAPVEYPEYNGHPMRRYAPCGSIGGIGLFRTRAFERYPQMQAFAGGRGGFTDWQLKHPDIVKGWVVPPLDLFLLDRLPIEPWLSLGRKYEAQGQQRPWTHYSEETARTLAGWWL
jgi:hypothetical protein